MKIDLHCHTTASDGLFSPAELIKKAVDEKVQMIALSDHDTINGIEEALSYNTTGDIIIVPAVEFSIDYDHGTFHLLGYNLDYKNDRLNNRLQELFDYRFNRIYDMVQSLKDNGINLPVDEVIEEADGGAAGKPHVARVMIKHGYASSIDEVFENYLADGKPGDVPKKRIKLDEAFEIIHESGGYPVIAHPRTIGHNSYEDFSSFIDEMIKKGLVGLEVYSSVHDSKDVSFFSAIAKEKQLIEFGGSDFHGDRGEQLGFYGDGRLIPADIVRPIIDLLKI